MNPISEVTNMKKDAIISDCGKFRYALSREWDAELPKVMFIMLNPSKADALEDDPTITRCIGFAKSWGYGGILVGNLYAYRATDPKELKANGYQTGYHNSANLITMAKMSDKIVCAWGNNIKKGDNMFRAFGIWGLTEKLHYLRLSKQNQPWHPLYLPGDLTPIKYHQLTII